MKLLRSSLTIPFSICGYVREEELSTVFGLLCSPAIAEIKERWVQPLKSRPINTCSVPAPIEICRELFFRHETAVYINSGAASRLEHG
jgi:hypothetical protein